MADKKSFIGEVKISENVVASIVGIATCEVEGVKSLAGNFTNEIIAKFGIKNNSKGVKLSIDNKAVTADIYINVIYGFSIPEVSELVQEKVKFSVESMTGLDVNEVNVRIVGIIVNQA